MRRGGFKRGFRRFPLWRPLFWWPHMFMIGAFTFLLYDVMAYEFYRNDVQRIEEETGKPANELTEEELVTAMKRLDIKKLELTPQDRKNIANSQLPDTKYCIQCGTKLPSKAVYCSQCGKKV